MPSLYTDIDPFCCEVLRARIADGSLPPGEVWERDISGVTDREIKHWSKHFTQVHLFCGIGGIPLGLAWAGWPDDLTIVTGGFPCQDVSVAGKGLGVDKGERSGLWKEMHRAIRVFRPTVVLAENVPALRTRGADRVLGDLEGIDYACTPLVVGAEHVGAPHKRHRVWVVGTRLDDPKGGRLRRSVRANNNGKTDRPIDAPEHPSRTLDVPDPQRHGRAEGSREPVDQGRAGKRRGQPAGGVQLADTPSGGLGADGTARDGGRHADELEQAAVHAAKPGLEGHRTHAGQPQERERRSAGPPMRWPAPPGPHQHGWEAPRLIESRMGDPADGLPRRLAGYKRRHGLKALGNAVVPQTVALVAEAIIRHARMMRA